MVGLLAHRLCVGMFPDGTRGRAMSIAASLNWVANLVVSLTFLSVADALGQSAAFFLYAGVSALAAVIVAIWVPETKDAA